MKIIANSLPKSGTHVLTRILDLIGLQENKIHFSGALIRRTSKNPLKNVDKYLKTTKSNVDGIRVDLDIEHYMKEKEFEKLFSQFMDNTYSQGHLPFDAKIINFLEKYNIKMLYIIRDPRDVLISHFHHHLRDDNYAGHKLMNILQDDKERILKSLFGFNNNTQSYTAPLRERISRTIKWYDIKHPLVLSLKFEDIIGVEGDGSEEKQVEMLIKIENFLDLEPNSLVNKKDKIFYKKSDTFRKGKINDWQNYLDDDLLKIIYSEIGAYIDELGYKR